jgi:hypothetical protein
VKKAMTARQYPTDMDRVPLSEVVLLRLAPITDPAIPRLVESIVRTLRAVEAEHRQATRDERREVTLWTKAAK